MRSSTERPTEARIALFIALAALLQAAETLVSTPVPWLRLGLGNALVLAAMALYGFGPGFSVALGKVLLGALITGKLFGPGFFLSLGGSVAAALTMGLLLNMPFGFAGLSAAGASAHALVELWLARWLILSTPAVYKLLPVLGALSVLTGIATGFLAKWLYDIVRDEDEKRRQKETDGL